MALAIAHVRLATTDVAMTMQQIVTALALASASVSAVAAQSGLRTGSVLIYQTPDGRETPWIVDSAIHDATLHGRPGCSRVSYAPGGPSPNPEVRYTCIAGDTLYSWRASDSTWRPSRPIGTAEVLELPTRTGRVRYVTAAAANDTIGGAVLRVILTTIETRDSAGTVIRRLRERFAPALGTATWGVFEVPDPAAPGGWRPVQEFRLIRAAGLRGGSGGA